MVCFLLFATRATYLGIVLALFVWSPPAGGQSSRPLLDAFFPVGKDFCFGRTYDAAHLSRVTRQTVKAIFIGGRNAQRTASAPEQGKDDASAIGKVYVSLAVTFRDSARSWSGVCFEETAGTVNCKILPHRNRDSVEQGLTLRQAGQDLAVEAVADWEKFRQAVDDDGSGNAAPDDRLFRVARLPLSACRLNRALWSPRGATDKFLSDFP